MCRNLLIAFLILFIVPSFSSAAQKSHLRGQRYCEIIVSQSISDFAVYNTIGLNDCPQKIWDKITVDDIKKETGSHLVHLNGPRYWMIDGMQNSNLVTHLTHLAAQQDIFFSSCKAI